MEQSREMRRAARYARLMDLRFVLALLFSIFGVIVTITGLTANSAEIEKAAGINISLWTGLALLLLAAFFSIWLLRSPPEVPTSTEDRGEGSDAGGDLSDPAT